MGQKIRRAPLGCEHIGIGFRAIWCMMIQYPLGATCFTIKQYHKLQAKYLPAFLSKMGINQMTPTAIRHGPPHLGGMDIFRLDTEQGIQHTKLIITHFPKEDEVGKLLHISLDHLQLQAGVSWPVLSQPGHAQWMYIDPCYLSHTWDFLDSIDSQLCIETPAWIRHQ
jgi:hypothetical protein